MLKNTLCNSLMHCWVNHWLCFVILTWHVSGHWLNAVNWSHWGPDKVDDILQTTFSNAFCWMKMFWLQLKFHWVFFPKGPIHNIPALVQIMAWRGPGEKPLSEPMMIILPMHICVTQLQWLNIHLGFGNEGRRLPPALVSRGQLFLRHWQSIFYWILMLRF